MARQGTQFKSATAAEVLVSGKKEIVLLFNPQKKRWAFSDEGGGLRYVNSRAPSPGDPIGNFASCDISDVVGAWLVGLQAEIAPTIHRAVTWLDRAIQDDERFGESQDYHRQTLRWARALGKWMEHGTQDAEDWAAAMRHEEASWSGAQRPVPPKQIIQNRLDDYMAFSVQAACYERGIETYERLAGAKKPSLGKTLKPRHFAYAICLRQQQGAYDEQALFEAGRKMLQANLEETWLGGGQSIRAATWLKIVYWDKDLREGRSPALTPLQTLLKAYENMPNVPMPPFVHQG
jgi:hypothetical protein